MMNPLNYDQLLSELIRIEKAQSPDPLESLSENLSLAVTSLNSQNPLIRPQDSLGRGGGLIFLNTELPLLILPDLHARKDFLLKVLLSEMMSGGTVLEWLRDKRIQILCVGDGFHAEKRAHKRWVKSLDEYKTNYRRHKNMDKEMAESLGLMQMIMLLQSFFPDHFFFLKGNHENILNEEGRGNHPFGKFVYEGEMVKSWTEKFLGKSFLYAYSEYEHSLPFMALANNLIISHAEPREYYSPEEIIEIHEYENIKLGLTWTANNQADEDSVSSILDDYSRRFNRDFTHYIGGHRTINTLYNLRASGRFVQIHNPMIRVVLITDQQERFNPDKNISDLDTLRSLPL
ncbi:hypothetical protein EXM22_05785 [Oceanispirochaeta crateris]|uniref:Uncharacterized protein n=1 Tax=Oceanispirochaeta crateris TaxID=2518645 RepID=A0A5C1QHB3_9SPIO|nr:metallophosphoesterase [Oceanispirochaeta crateris]QEN07523.1 hypothetical protein EXM22_05785 [Oceanispirochaeta crateris]